MCWVQKKKMSANARVPIPGNWVTFSSRESGRRTISLSIARTAQPIPQINPHPIPERQYELLHESALQFDFVKRNRVYDGAFREMCRSVTTFRAG